ncbi:MAG TPA: translation initiation factor IF-2 N-terminal domain-containing protein, partial [Pyrinomonadaceae bacterium]|nr:translation initiation factor IF-2 N-terminal domain-containing protein [Pyrinomonadaceae bacterium]
MTSPAHTSKVRIYDLAKELKMESKRLLEEVRREGVDVSVPSNTISKELAEKIRNKHFPKKESAAPRTIRVVKKARPAEGEHGEAHAPAPSDAPAPEVYADDAPDMHAHAHEPSHEHHEGPGAPAVRPLQPRVIKKLAPAARAERPESATEYDGGAATAPAHAPADQDFHFEAAHTGAAEAP